MIKFEHLQKSYRDKVIFDNVNFQLTEVGRIYTIIGSSGSGKTTLLNIIFGLDLDYQGTYQLFEKDVATLSRKAWQHIRNHDLQIVFQDYKLTEKMTVEENLKNAGDFSQDEIKEVLTNLGIQELLKEKIWNLSGGQKQRVAIARAMLFHPKILLLDEPTSGLDDETTTSFLNYIEKLKNTGLTVLIISHNKAVAEKSDFVYRIEDKTLHLVNKRNSETITQTTESRGKSSEKKKLWRYTLTSLKANRVELSLMMVPMIVILALFILGFSFYYHLVIDSYEKMFSGLSDRVIMLDTQELKKEYLDANLEKGILSSLDGQRLYFSQSDVEHVKSISGIDDLVLTNGSQSSLVDMEGFEIDLAYQVAHLPQVLKSEVGFLDQGTSIYFKFKGLTTPYSFIRDYNTLGIKLLVGDFPKDDSLDILIPDIYAKIYLEEDDVEKIVGQEISLQTFRYEKAEELVYRKYRVSGVYRTNYNLAFQSTYYFYLPWDKWNTMKEEDFDWNESFEADKIAHTGGSKETAIYLEKIFQSLESYQQAFGLGYPTMLVKVEKPQDVVSVSKELEAYFPKYRLMSQWSWKEGEYASIYQYERNKMLIIAVIIASTLGILITFLNKSYFKRRNRELAVLYSLGYSRRQLVQLILVENLLVFLTCLGLAYALDSATYQFYLRKTIYFSPLHNMYSNQVIYIIIALVFLITIISVVWNIQGVRISNLKKSLNE